MGYLEGNTKRWVVEDKDLDGKPGQDASRKKNSFLNRKLILVDNWHALEFMSKENCNLQLNEAG